MSKQLQLPVPISAFIEATNAHETDELFAALSADAVITDEGHEYRGIAAIKQWSDERYIGAKVVLEAVNVINRDHKTIVMAKVDGNFDKTGLPDPFYMDLHFVVDGNKVSALDFRLPDE
jgi:SnoaL-like domain